MEAGRSGLSAHAVARHRVVATTTESESVSMSKPERLARWTALLFVAAFFCLPFLVPIHRLPSPTFDSELLSVMLLASALTTAGICSGRLNVCWPIPAFLLAVLSLGLLQNLLGWLDYSSRLTSLAMWVVAVLSAYCLGRWFVQRAWSTLALRAVCGALIVGGLVSVVVQVLQVLDIPDISPWLVSPHGTQLATANGGQCRTAQSTCRVPRTGSGQCCVFLSTPRSPAWLRHRWRPLDRYRADPLANGFDDDCPCRGRPPCRVCQEWNSSTQICTNGRDFHRPRLRTRLDRGTAADAER